MDEDMDSVQEEGNFIDYGEEEDEGEVLALHSLEVLWEADLEDW